ncbi:Fe(3+) ABC transporter substrate-binding protein [Romeriopsis navalis]|nr:Fe(3+) ABC transporter substrate-binding protein [Romeriopsis navalis]
MLTRRFFCLASSATIGAIALGACTPQSTTNNSTPNASGAAQSITLYSARHYDADAKVYENFSKKTGIKVNLVEAKASELLERLKSEGENTPADVVITVDAGRLHTAKADEILQPIQSDVLTAAIPENLRDKDGNWFGVTKRARVILYNKDTVSDPSKITSYEDLAKPDLGYKVLVRSSNNIYNQSLVGSILAANGEAGTEDWVKGLVKNFARPPEGNDTAQIKALASGLGDLAIVNSYYVVRVAKSKNPKDQEVISKVGMIFPNQSDRGTHVNISGAGVAKNAPNKAGAIKFIEYLVSPEAQAIFASSNNEYPILKTGAKVDEKLASYGEFKEDSLSAEVFGKNNKQALEIMDRGGWK